MHRKDGQSHPRFQGLSWKDLVALDKDEYVPLCRMCHSAVHWVMRNFDFSWEQIITFSKYEKAEGSIPSVSIEETALFW